MSYQLSGQSDQAITLLEGLAKKHPNSFDVVFNLGTILASQNHLSPAVLYLTKAVQLRPEDVEAHWKLGLAKGLMGHTLEAVRHLEIAHTIQPDNHWLLCHLTLGVQQATLQGIEAFPQIVHSSEGKTLGSEKELTALADLIAKEPEFVTAFLDLPKSDVDQSIFSALLTILVRSLEKYPEYADLHYHCSCVLDRLGQKERAICESKRALEINPRYVNALIHLAKVYASTHQNQEAIDRLSKAIELGANFADVHYLLGNLYRKQGCLEHARQHYRKALKLNERYYAAKEAMGELVHS
jgi:superkiller protein 3